jgi:hypothetical protein
VKKNFLTSFVSALLLISNMSNSSASDNTSINYSSTSISTKYWDVPLSTTCKGRIDYPHISKHVKGTVNVVMSINCGKELVHIEGLLYRMPIEGIHDIGATDKSGVGKLQINLALPCKYEIGKKLIKYTVVGRFQASNHYDVLKKYDYRVNC